MKDETIDYICTEQRSDKSGFVDWSWDWEHEAMSASSMAHLFLLIEFAASDTFGNCGDR